MLSEFNYIINGNAIVVDFYSPVLTPRVSFPLMPSDFFHESFRCTRFRTTRASGCSFVDCRPTQIPFRAMHIEIELVGQFVLISLVILYYAHKHFNHTDIMQTAAILLFMVIYVKYS